MNGSENGGKSCTGVERERNGVGTGTGVPLNGLFIGSFFWRLLYMYMYIYMYMYMYMHVHVRTVYMCRMAVAKYKEKWCKKESIDKHVLDEWEHTVYSCIDRTIEYLKQNNTVKRKKHILKKKKHLVNLEHIQGENVLIKLRIILS